MPRPKIEPNRRAYDKARAELERALDSFVESKETEEANLGSYVLDGTFLYLAERNEYWFKIIYHWTDSMATQGWGRIFEDQREFDGLTGSPDPPDSWGFRHVDTLQEAYEGNHE